MTGATGSLTPDNADEDFVPAETRAVPGGPGSVKGPPTDYPADRSGEDVARAEPRPRSAGGDTALGGDVRREPEDEHL